MSRNLWVCFWESNVSIILNNIFGLWKFICVQQIKHCPKGNVFTWCQDMIHLKFIRLDVFLFIFYFLQSIHLRCELLDFIKEFICLSVMYFELSLISQVIRFWFFLKSLICVVIALTLSPMHYRYCYGAPSFYCSILWGPMSLIPLRFWHPS